jgi:hypothetical protein
MQLVITEKQLRKLSSQITANQAVTEEDGDAAAAAPEAGTSSDGANKTGASKWESGVTRGPGNQIGVTKWSDVVGSSLKRGKANPLQEQYGENVTILTPNGVKMQAPAGTKILSYFTQTEINGGGFFKDSLRYWYPKSQGGEGNSYTEEWLPDNWSRIITLNSVAQFQLPNGKIYSARISHPKLNAISGQPMQKFFELDPDPNGWRFNGYFDRNGKGFVGLGTAGAVASGAKRLDPKNKISDYVYKTDDGEGVIVNLVKGEFAEALLDIRKALFTVEGMAIEATVEFALSETVIVPIAIEVLNASIMLNDLSLYLEQGEEDEEALWRVIEDLFILGLRFGGKYAIKNLRGWLKTPAGKTAVRWILEKLGVIIQTIGGWVAKLPGKGLRTYVMGLLKNTSKLRKIIGKTTGAYLAKIPAQYRRGIVAGLLTYVSGKALEKLVGAPEGTIDKQMANGGVPSDELITSIQNVSKSDLTPEEIKTAADLEIIGSNAEYAIGLADFFKDTYPCLSERIKNKKFIVAIHTQDKDIYKIDGVEYINEGAGITNVQTGEDFVC